MGAVQTLGQTYVAPVDRCRFLCGVPLLVPSSSVWFLVLILKTAFIWRESCAEIGRRPT